MKELLRGVYSGIGLLLLKIVFALTCGYLFIFSLDRGLSGWQFVFCSVGFSILFFSKFEASEKLKYSQRAILLFILATIVSLANSPMNASFLFLVLCSALVVILVLKIGKLNEPINSTAHRALKFLKPWLLIGFVGSAMLPLNFSTTQIESDLRSKSTEPEKVIEICEKSVAHQASHFLAACALRLYFDPTQIPENKALSLKYAEKSLELSRAAPILAGVETRYAKIFACIGYSVAGAEKGLLIARRYSLDEQVRQFTSGKDCGWRK